MYNFGIIFYVMKIMEFYVLVVLLIDIMYWFFFLFVQWS